MLVGMIVPGEIVVPGGPRDNRPAGLTPDGECGKMSAMKTIIEPFKIKSVEPIKLHHASKSARKSSAAGRLQPLPRPGRRRAHRPADRQRHRAMSADQWAGIMRGDESYAGARSFFRFEAKVRELTGLQHIIPTHQGRAAERILFAHRRRAGQIMSRTTPISTPRGPTSSSSGAKAVDLAIDRGHRSRPHRRFKGNMDPAALRAAHRARSAPRTSPCA